MHRTYELSTREALRPCQRETTHTVGSGVLSCDHLSLFSSVYVAVGQHPKLRIRSPFPEMPPKKACHILQVDWVSRKYLLQLKPADLSPVWQVVGMD